MPEKLDRCVADIKAKGKADGVNPYAVCNASINESEHFDKLYEALMNEGGPGSGPQGGISSKLPKLSPHTGVKRVGPKGKSFQGQGGPYTVKKRFSIHPAPQVAKSTANFYKKGLFNW